MAHLMAPTSCCRWDLVGPVVIVLLVLGLWRISVLLKGMGLLETAIASGAGKHGHSKKKKPFLEICTWEA